MKKPASDLYVVVVSLLAYCIVIFTGCSRPKQPVDPDRGQIDGYTYCGEEETCSEPRPGGIYMWCDQDTLCTRQDSCHCLMFVKGIQQPDSMWRISSIVDTLEWLPLLAPLDTLTDYSCRCVRE